MNPTDIGRLIDLLLPIIGGIIISLYAFRVIGPKPGQNAKFDALCGKWGMLFKWVGPLLILLSVIQYVAFASKSHASDKATETKEQVLQRMQINVSTEGKLADRDLIVESPDGFTILIPKGFTYSKPPRTPFSLVALYDVNGAATPGMSVSIVQLEGNLESVISDTKKWLLAKNPETIFSETKALETGRNRSYRISLSRRQSDGVVKGEMLFFQKNGKVFMLNLGTKGELFEANTSLFEKIIHSFGPV